MLRVAASELAGRLARGFDPLELAADPLVVIDGGDPGVDPATMAGVPAVFVGDGEALDLGVDDDHELAQVAATVAAHPVGAVALAVLLRGSEHRSIGEGLVAESATYSLLQAGPDHGGWLAGRTKRAAVTDEPDEVVEIRRHDDVLELTLQRPARHNAFNIAMRDALLEGLAVAVADPDLTVVIDGAGPSFCSGGDLDEFGTRSDPATAHLVRLAYSVGRVIASMADRVTVRVHGACAGAGVELPAFAGRVVAAADARFWLPEVVMGLVPGAGGTVSLPRRIGRRRTARLALLGSPIDAATALDWGLIDAVG